MRTFPLCISMQNSSSSCSLAALLEQCHDQGNTMAVRCLWQKCRNWFEMNLQPTSIAPRHGKTIPLPSQETDGMETWKEHHISQQVCKAESEKLLQKPARSDLCNWCLSWKKVKPPGNGADLTAYGLSLTWQPSLPMPITSPDCLYFWPTSCKLGLLTISSSGLIIC